MCGFEVVQDPRLLAVYRHWGIPETAKDGLGGVAWWAGVVAEVAAVIRANNVSAAVQAVLLWHADQRLARQRGQRPRAFDVPPETLKVRGVFWRNLLNGSFLMFAALGCSSSSSRTARSDSDIAGGRAFKEETSDESSNW